MNLNMIAIETAHGLPKRVPLFRWTAHHVKEIFLAMLPHKFNLDGSGKVQITCGPRHDEPQYHQVLGTSNYFKEDFDFVAYYAMKPTQREEAILKLIQECFTDIARRHGQHENEAHISPTCEAVRLSQFRLALDVKKLSRRFRSAKIKIWIRRVLSRDEGESWRCDVIHQAKGLLYSEWLGEHPSYLYGAGLYKQSRLDGFDFEIRDALGKVRYQLNLRNIVSGIDC